MAESRLWGIIAGLAIWSALPVGLLLGLRERRHCRGVTLDCSQPIVTVTEPVLETATPAVPRRVAGSAFDSATAEIDGVQVVALTIRYDRRCLVWAGTPDEARTLAAALTSHAVYVEQGLARP